MLAQDQGDYEEAQARYEQALSIFEELGDQTGMATSSLQLGIVAKDAGDDQLARSRYEQALAIYEGLTDHIGTALAYHHLAVLAQLRGETPQAISALLDKALDHAALVSTATKAGQVMSSVADRSAEIGCIPLLARSHAWLLGRIGSGEQMRRAIDTSLPMLQRLRADGYTNEVEAAISSVMSLLSPAEAERFEDLLSQ